MIDGIVENRHQAFVSVVLNIHKVSPVVCMSDSTTTITLQKMNMYLLKAFYFYMSSNVAFILVIVDF